MQKQLFSLLTLSLITLTSLAQNVELKLTLRDGNILSGQSKLGNITLITDYGKLDVPLKNVSSIDVGITADNSNSEKITGMLKQLSNSSEEMRKNAYEALVKMNIGTIIIIEDFINSEKYILSDYTDYTVDMALSELKATHGVDDSYSSKDIVVIDSEYSMGGTYNFKVIDLKTEYGTLIIPKEKIKHIDVMYIEVDGKGETAYTLQAAKHISGNLNGGWLRTGIMVKTGQKLNITANGEVTLASLSNSKYKPNGSVKNASTETGYEDEYYDEGNSTYPTYGNVVYKIGENGTVMKAGAKFSGNVTGSGMLYLAIYETVHNANNKGSYIVKVNLK